MVTDPPVPAGIVSHYQSQPWLMERSALQGFVQRLAALPAASQLPQIAVPPRKIELAVADGVARIAIRGVLLDSVPGWLRIWGIEATGYDEIIEQMGQAEGRADVTRIELAIDSPGGMVAGVIEAAAAIYKARSSKRVDARITNLGASAAYWLASQAGTIEAADPNTLVGSIGVYTWFVDWTGFEDKAGIKVIVVRSGEHKGMGLDAITENQIAAVQQYIDAIGVNFVADVARGRKGSTETFAELATGQLWIAGRAKELGLVDTVRNPAASTQTSRISGDVTMDTAQQQNQTASAATPSVDVAAIQQQASAEGQAAERTRLADLKAAFPEDLAYAVTAFEKGQNVNEARADYCDVLKAKLAEKDKQTPNPQKATGAAPLPTGESESPDGNVNFLEAARALAAEKNISVTAAMKKLRRQNPQLHEDFKVSQAG